MKDLRQIVSAITVVLLSGSMMIIGQVYMDHRSEAKIGRPAMVVAYDVR